MGGYLWTAIIDGYLQTASSGGTDSASHPAGRAGPSLPCAPGTLNRRSVLIEYDRDHLQPPCLMAYDVRALPDLVGNAGARLGREMLLFEGANEPPPQVSAPPPPCAPRRRRRAAFALTG